MDMIYRQSIEDWVNKTNRLLKVDEQTLSVGKKITSILALPNNWLVLGCVGGTIVVARQGNIFKEFLSDIDLIFTILDLDNKILLVGENGKMKVFGPKFEEIEGFRENNGFLLMNQELKSFDLSLRVSATFYSKTLGYLTFGGTHLISNKETVVIMRFINGILQFDELVFEIEDKINDLSIQSCNLIVSTENNLQVWKISNNEIENKLEVNLEKKIEFPKISKILCSFSKVFVCSEEILFEYNIETNEKKQVLANISDFTFFNEEKFIFSVSIDTNDTILNIIDVLSCEIIGFSILKNVSLCKVCANSNYIVARDFDSVKLLQINENFDFKSILECKSEIIGLVAISDTHLFSIEKNSIITKISIPNGSLGTSEVEKQIEYPEDIISCFAINELTSELAVGNEQNTIKLYSLPDLTEKETLTTHKLPIRGLHYCGPSLVSFASDSTQGEYYIWSNKKIFFDNSANFFRVAGNSKHFIFSSVGYLNFVNLLGVNVKMPFNDKEILNFTCNEKYFAVIGKEIVIWEMESIGILCNLSYNKMEDNSEIKCSVLINDYLLIGTTKNMHIISIINRVLIGTISIHFRPSRLIFTDTRIFISSGSEIKSMRNIFSHDSEISVIGPVSLPNLSFKLYFNHIFNNDQANVCPDHMYKWVILPDCINILQLLSYKSNNLLLKKSFKLNTDLLVSIQGYTPLTIALVYEFRETTKYLIKKIARMSSSNEYLLNVFENDLPYANLSISVSIGALYKQAFIVPKQRDLPVYAKVDFQEKISISKSYYIYPSSFSQENLKAPEEYVTYLTSNFKLPFSEGSPSSIFFLKSLLICNDSSVFSTPLIKNYLNYKWRRAQLLLVTHSFLYLMFLVCLTLNILVTNDIYSLIGLILLNTVDFIYEILQFKYNPLTYVKSKTNWADLIRIFITYYHAVQENSKFLNQDQYATVIIIVSFLRGIIYFKMFKNTRYMIKMIEEIMKDSIFFAFILIYMLIAFSTFFHYSRIDTEKTFVSSLSKVYLMGYGEFDFDESSSAEWFAVVLISFGLPLVMFNLLIAIMGDTYQRVYDGMIETDFKAMTQLVLDAEIVMSNFVGQNDHKFYLQKCVVGSENYEVVDDQIIPKVQGCIRNINELTDCLANTIKKEDQFLQTIQKIRAQKIEMTENIRKNILKKYEILNELSRDQDF